MARVNDPISDLLTRVRNANSAFHEQVDIPHSKIKEELVKLMKKEGFIKDYQVIQTDAQGVLRVFLKFNEGRERTIAGLKRISKPGMRVYVEREEIPKIFGGLGTVVMSTSKGIMTGRQARKNGLGGEVMAYIW
jgi:small subunit ribosomal protein S8